MPSKIGQVKQHMERKRWINMKRRLLALVLAWVMVLGLCACGGKDSGKDGGTPGGADGSAPGGGTAQQNGADQNTGTVADANKDADIYSWIPAEDTGISGTVRFYVPFGGDQGMDAMIAEFNEMYPHITVELNTYKNNADGNIALNTAIMAGECDVVASFEIHNLMNRLSNGMYLDLTDRVAEEGISLVDNWGTAAYNVDGRTYVLPCGGLSHYVAINMTAWEAAGLGELPEAWTWDEYIEASRAMTERNADGSTKVYGGSNYQVITDLLDVMYQVNGCNRFYNADGSCAFASDVMKEAVGKFIDAEKEGVWFSLDTYRADNDKTWFAYTDGRINSSVSANLARFLRDTENYPLDFITGIAPYPTMEAGQTNYESGVNYFSFAGITRGCQDEEAAWAFTKWYATYGSKYLAIAGHQSTWAGTDPGELVSLIFGSEENAAKIVDVDSFKKFVGNPANPSSYDNISRAYSELASIWEEYVMYAYTGNMTVEDALNEAARLGDEAISAAR